MNYMNAISAGRVFFDTNIIVYSHDRDDIRKRDIASDLLFHALKKRRGVISAQVLGETFVTFVKKYHRDPDEATDEIRKLTRFRVVDLTAALVLRGLEIKAQFGLSYWDSLIIAAAERASCKVIFSEDLNDGQTYGSVLVMNPFT